MDTPAEVKLLVPPRTASMTGGRFIDVAGTGKVGAVLKDFIFSVVEEAVADPSSRPPARNSLSFPVSIGSTQRMITIAPYALPALLIQRYCAGAWRAANRLGNEAFVYYFNLNPGGYRWPRDSMARLVPPPPREDAAQFIKAYTGARTRLDALVANSLAQIHADAWRIAGLQIKEKIAQCDSDLKRYFGSSGVSADAKSLLESMTRLVAAANAFIVWRSTQSFERDPPEGAEGGSAANANEAGRQAWTDEQTAPLKREFEAALVEASSPPRNHWIAPALLGMIFAGSPTSIHQPEDSEVLDLAQNHLNRTIVLLQTAMPPREPAENFRAALDRPLGRRTNAVVAPEDASFEDSLEFRAAVWVTDTKRQYLYHPLNDEALMISLLSSYAATLRVARNDFETGVAALRYQALAGYLAAWQNAKLLVDLERAEGHPVADVINEAAGVVDLLSIKVPVLQGPARLLLAAVLVAQLVTQLLEVPELQRATDANSIGPLFRDEYATYVQILIKRPTVLSVCVDFGLHTAAAVVGFSTLERVRPSLALKLRILGDVSPWLIPGVSKAIHALLDESAKKSAAR